MMLFLRMSIARWVVGQQLVLWKDFFAVFKVMFAFPTSLTSPPVNACTHHVASSYHVHSHLVNPLVSKRGIPSIPCKTLEYIQFLMTKVSDPARYQLPSTRRSFGTRGRLTLSITYFFLTWQYRLSIGLLGGGISEAEQDLTGLISGGIVSISSLSTCFLSTGLPAGDSTAARWTGPADAETLGTEIAVVKVSVTDIAGTSGGGRRNLASN